MSLGAINERYEALCDVRMYVCTCLKLSVNYGQTVEVFVVFFFYKTEWVCMVLRILNLEGQLNCMIGSIVKANLPPFFSKTSKTSNIGMWGVYPETIYLNIVLCTQILIWASISEV